jgi:PadR family transcriptional regulator PadR
MEGLSEMLKGVLEGIVLEIISREEIYGYAIARRLSALGLPDVAEGTVYALLVRLERNRWVLTAKKPSDIGPPRKFYTLSDRGQQELVAFWARWNFLSGRMDILKTDGGSL